MTHTLTATGKGNYFFCSKNETDAKVERVAVLVVFTISFIPCVFKFVSCNYIAGSGSCSGADATSSSISFTIAAPSLAFTRPMHESKVFSCPCRCLLWVGQCSDNPVGRFNKSSMVQPFSVPFCCFLIYFFSVWQKWEYGHKPTPGSKESKLMEVLLKPKDWAWGTTRPFEHRRFPMSGLFKKTGAQKVDKIITIGQVL